MFKSVATTLSVLLIFAMVFGMAAITGASIQVDDTKDKTDLQNATADLDDLSENVSQNMSDSGPTAYYKDYIVMPMVNSAENTAIMGVKWGYNNPQKARIAGKVIPVVAIGSMGYLLYRQIQRLRRQA